MKKWIKRIIKIAMLINIFFVSAILMSSGINAATNAKVNFSGFIAGTEDISAGTIKPQLVYDKKLDTLEFSFNTNGYQKKYYTATAFKNLKMNTSEYAGIAFNIKNNLNTPVRMNFAITDDKQKTMDAKNDFYVLLEGKEKSYAKVEYGCFEIPAAFEGRVEIPFGVLAFQETGELDNAIEKMSGYGIIFVTQQNESCDMTFSEISFLTKEETVDLKEACELIIEGEEKTLRPKIGKSDSYFHTSVYDMTGKTRDADAVFSLNTENEYAEITNDGKLTIDSRCNEESIEIKAETKDGLVATYSIKLYDSWTNELITQDGVEASLAEPSEISAIRYIPPNLKTQDALWILRFILMGAGLIFGIYYLFLRKKLRKIKKIERLEKQAMEEEKAKNKKSNRKNKSELFEADNKDTKESLKEEAEEIKEEPAETMQASKADEAKEEITEKEESAETMQAFKADEAKEEIKEKEEPAEAMQVSKADEAKEEIKEKDETIEIKETEETEETEATEAKIRENELREELKEEIKEELIEELKEELKEIAKKDNYEENEKAETKDAEAKIAAVKETTAGKEIILKKKETGKSKKEYYAGDEKYLRNMAKNHKLHNSIHNLPNSKKMAMSAKAKPQESNENVKKAFVGGGLFVFGYYCISKIKNRRDK